MPSRRSDSDYEAPSEDADREASGEDENKGKGKGKHKRGGRRGGRAVRERQFALQASSPPPIGSDIILVNRRADQAANLTTIEEEHPETARLRPTTRGFRCAA